MYVHRQTEKKFWGWWGPPIWRGVWLMPQKYAPPPCVTVQNVVILGGLSNGLSIIAEVSWINPTPRIQTFKVTHIIGTNTG